MKKIKTALLISLIILSLLALTGCTSILSLTKKETEERISNLSASSIIIGSDDIRSLTVNLIKNAKKAIHLQLSSLDDPDIIQLLIDQSQAGIEVRILLDQWQRENTTTVQTLKNQNISVHYFPAQKGQYQRVRYMVIDHKLAIFFSEDLTKKGFGKHSMAIKLSGGTAWTIAKSFNKDWIFTTTTPLVLPVNIELPADNITFALNSNVKQQVLRQINNATLEIKAVLEQLSDPETVEAILQAKQRGCNIQLILSPSCAIATPNTIKKFKDAGIDVRYFNHENKLPMGFNIGVFDNKTLVMTSSSWTYNSFVINHEASLTIPSPAAIEKVNSLFEQDWNNASPA